MFVATLASPYFSVLLEAHLQSLGMPCMPSQYILDASACAVSLKLATEGEALTSLMCCRKWQLCGKYGIRTWCNLLERARGGPTCASSLNSWPAAASMTTCARYTSASAPLKATSALQYFISPILFCCIPSHRSQPSSECCNLLPSGKDSSRFVIVNSSGTLKTTEMS